MQDMKLKRLLVVIILGIFFGACSKDSDNTPHPVKPDSSNTEIENGVSFYKDVTIASFANDDIGSCLDLKTGYVYTIEDAGKKPSHIDVVILQSRATEINLLTASSTSYTSWGAPMVKEIPDKWSVHNEGTLIEVKRPTNKEETLYFDQIERMEDIQEAFDYMYEEVPDRPVPDGAMYKASYFGPTERLRSIEEGDLILYRSDSTQERRIVSVMKVMETGETDSRKAYMNLQIKTASF